MLLLCSFLRLKELFQVKNDLTTSLPFFENAKNLGRSDDAQRRKKRPDDHTLLKIRKRRILKNKILLILSYALWHVTTAFNIRMNLPLSGVILWVLRVLGQGLKS